MVALVIEDHQVPDTAVEKILPSSRRKVLFVWLSLCNLTMALFIFSARPLSRNMYVVDLPFEKFEALDPIELLCGFQLFMLAIVWCAENIEKKMSPVITVAQIFVIGSALLLIASCSYSTSSLQTNLAVHCRETTNSDELLGLGMCSKDVISNLFMFHVVMIYFGRVVIIFQVISPLFLFVLKH